MHLMVFAACVTLTWSLTPLALRFALKRQIMDHPSAIKSQPNAVPYLGGVVIVAVFSLAIMAASAIGAPRSEIGELSVIIGLGLVLSGVGLVDDLRGLGPFIRLVIEVAAATILFIVGVRVEIFDLVALNAILTILWVVTAANAFNLLDNMDGLSAGIAAISALFFFLIAAMNGQVLVAALSIALVGCATGFLLHNFHPARIYMGDAGSLYLGFLLAVVGIKLRFESPVEITFLVPVMVLGVAIFDTVLVVTTRALNQRNPWSGGQDHTSHRLVFIGLPVPVAVAAIYLGQVALGWLALIMTRVDLITGFMLMGFVLSFALMLGIMLACVPVYGKSRRRHLMISETKPHEVEPETRLTADAPRSDVVPARPQSARSGYRPNNDWTS